QAVEAALNERDAILRSIEETKHSEEKNLKRIEEMRSQIATLETRAQTLESMIRQAERDAETTRKQAKEEADAYRKSVAEQAEAERVAVKKNAEAQAAAHVQSAEA